MKPNSFIVKLIAVGCILLLQTGCQQPETVTSQSKPVVSSVETEPAVSKVETEPLVSPVEAKPVVSPTPQAEEKTGPRVRFEKIYHNFGDVGPSSTNLCEFNFTNTGDSILKITRVSKTCGCTPFTLAKKEYAPGESGTLKVKYISAKTPGLAVRRLFIYSNDETAPKTQVTVRAQIVLKIDYKPKTMKLLLRDENAGCPKIELKSVDDKPFAIIDFKSTANSITADYDRSVTATSFVLEPKVDIEKVQKSLRGHVSISLTHPECKSVLIPFNALAEFRASPSVISVFNVEPQKPVKRELWVLDNYDEDFEVESAFSEKGTIKVLSQDKVGRRYKFELEIMPPAAESNPRVFTDTFIVNIKGGKKVEVICRGFYAK